MEGEKRLPLWWENAQHQVEWDEPGMNEADFRVYLDGFASGNVEFDTDDLREGLRHRFGVRVNVARHTPLVAGGPDHCEVITAEGLQRGVGTTSERGPVPPTR